VRGLGSQSANKQRGDDRPLSRLRSSLGMTAAAALALAVAAVTTRAEIGMQLHAAQVLLRSARGLHG